MNYAVFVPVFILFFFHPRSIYINYALIHVRFFPMVAVPHIILSYAVIPKVRMKLWRYESEL